MLDQRFHTIIRKLREQKTAIIMIVLSIAWFFIGWRVREFFLSEDILLVEQARNIILNNYNGDLPSSRDLTYAALRGMLYSIGDPRAVFYEADLGKRIREDYEGKYAGTGIRGEMQGEGLEITQINPGDPADQAGLQVGDLIVQVDKWKLKKDTTYQEVALMIRGREGTPVHITVERDGEILEFDVTRKASTVVTTRTIDSRIAYLYQQDFGFNAPQELKHGLDDLLARNPEGLIWDLRGNGGGSLTATVESLDYFFSDEEILLYSEGRNGELTPHRSSEGGIATEIPLVVLIDGRSYSAPEVVAATTRDLERGNLVGETTYGKGTINKYFPLLDGSVIQMTVARWLSPAQRWYGDKGVPPDMLVKDDEATVKDEVLECAIIWLHHPREQPPPECGRTE